MLRRLLLVSGSTALVAWILWTVLARPITQDPLPAAPDPLSIIGPAQDSGPTREPVAAAPTEHADAPPTDVDRPTRRTLRIRVTDAANRPTADATVRVRREHSRVGAEGEVLAQMRTDAAGSTSYEANSDTVHVEAEHGGARSGLVAVTKEWPADRVVEINLDDLLLVRGRVETAAGNAVAAAQIRVRRTNMSLVADRPRPIAPTVSAADGSFELRVERQGSYSIVAQRGEESSAEVHFDTIQRTPETIVVQFPGDWAVRGRVLGNDGTPRQAEIRVWECVAQSVDSRSHIPTAVRRVTEADGTFSIALPRLGQYVLVAAPHQPRGTDSQPLAHRELNSDLQRVNVSAMTPTVECVLRLSTPTSVRGQVTHADGRPASGARLIMLPEADPGAGLIRGPRHGDVFAPIGMVTTGSAGEFEFTEVQGGTTYRIHVWPDDRHERVCALRSGIVPGTQALRITLSPSEARGARLRLQLVFDDDGSPVPECRIDYVYYDRGQPESSSPLQVTAEGNLLVSQPISCGHEFGLTIRDRIGHFANDELVCSPVHIGPIVLSSDETRVIQVPRPVHLPVQVIDGEGRACAGLRVALLPITPRATSNMLHAAQTDELGHVRFRGTETGESLLTVNHGSKKLAELQVIVRSGRNPPITVRLN